VTESTDQTHEVNEATQQQPASDPENGNDAATQPPADQTPSSIDGQVDDTKSDNSMEVRVEATDMQEAAQDGSAPQQIQNTGSPN